MLDLSHDHSLNLWRDYMATQPELKVMVATNGAALSRFFMSNADFLKVNLVCVPKISALKSCANKMVKNTKKYKKDPKKGDLKKINCTRLRSKTQIEVALLRNSCPMYSCNS